MNGQQVALPFVGADLSVRRASSSFLLLQTFGAHLLWGLEFPAVYVTLQPSFASKVSRGLVSPPLGRGPSRQTSVGCGDGVSAPQPLSCLHCVLNHTHGLICCPERVGSTFPPTPWCAFSPLQVRGLCGTYNWNQQDEFTTPEGDVEPSIAAFTDKFRNTHECSSSPAMLNLDPCSTFTQHRQFAEEACAVLHSPPFQVREQGWGSLGGRTSS